MLIAKRHKLAERSDQPDRLFPKDAHDVYRLLVATETNTMAQSLRRLLAAPLASAVAEDAMHYLAELFGTGHDALGSSMAGRGAAGRHSAGLRIPHCRHPRRRQGAG